MSDDADRAQAIEERQRDLAVAAIRVGLTRRAPANHAPGLCVDCVDEIPPERLEAMPGAIRCIDCQEKLEMGGNAR